MSFRNNLIKRGKQLISLNDTGSLNQKILFSEGMGRVDREANTKMQGHTYVHTYIYKLVVWLSTNIERACLVNYSIVT